jgi:hypothetical protein
MNQRSKLNSQDREQQEQQAESQHTQQPAGLEFNTPEEMLRHDALHTMVPPGIPARLRDSTGGGGPGSAPAPWWKRIFGGTGD